MANLYTLYIFLTTSTKVDANSDSKLAVVYTTRSGEKKEFILRDLKHDERELGRTDLYIEKMDTTDDLSDIQDAQFKLVALGGDAWLPDSIFIIGRGNGFRVLVGRDKWPEDAWLSTQLSDADGKAEKARLLDSRATPTTA